MAIKFSLLSGSLPTNKPSPTPPKLSRALAESPPPCPRPAKAPLKPITANVFASPPPSQAFPRPTCPRPIQDAPKGKEFFFKELPRELRDMIYIYYISHEQPFGNFGKRNNRSDKYQLKLRKWCSLLLVCRQAHAEFAPLLYQAAHFTFNVGYVAGKYSVDARLVYKKEKLWKVSELLLQNLQQCTIKVEAGWRTDHGSNPKWNRMARELTKFLISFPYLHTVYVYVNRAELPHYAVEPNSCGYYPRQVAALDAVRSAFRLNPAIQELNITERLGHRFQQAYCRTTSISAHADGCVAEESYLVYSDRHMIDCELQCICENNDLECEEDVLYEGRDELPKASR